MIFAELGPRFDQETAKAVYAHAKEFMEGAHTNFYAQHVAIMTKCPWGVPLVGLGYVQKAGLHIVGDLTGEWAVWASLRRNMLACCSDGRIRLQGRRLKIPWQYLEEALMAVGLIDQIPPPHERMDDLYRIIWQSGRHEPAPWVRDRRAKV